MYLHTCILYRYVNVHVNNIIVYVDTGTLSALTLVQDVLYVRIYHVCHLLHNNM